MLKKVDGIVLKSIDYGETDKIVTLYTTSYGKMAVLAKGAKKGTSRFSAVTQPFVYGSFLFFQGRGMPSLSQGDVLQSFKTIHMDMTKAAYAAYMVELVDKLTEARRIYLHVFDWLIVALKQLETGYDGEVIARIVDLKMLTVAGAKPVLDYCAVCRSDTHDPTVFSITQAGFLCVTCAYRDQHAYPISITFAQLLRTLYYVDLNKIGTISISASTKKRLRTMLHMYYDEYVGIHLKTRGFITQLERYDPRLFTLDND
ncbi:DNA repair protein RecO [Shouchella lonarensis]|uniref:DNA repair protein RecO n=1 Tax=Shouchella lonarensis TaxID=1464122 RepID=A0A1G6KME6_9BACI|nr:DNA repair protein RecO [Shouchella lonarensis]SDC31506.1 DNA replication and repair protein RecO [Shouchella lonarensis]